MYTITLANGKKLTGLDMNGTNYVSKERWTRLFSRIISLP